MSPRSASLSAMDSSATITRTSIHQSSTPKQNRSSSCSGSGSSNGIHGGDYQVLRKQVERARSRVQQERFDLAARLDELGEHHVRRHEYEDAMDAFTEALREKRSVFWNIGNCNLKNLPEQQQQHHHHHHYASNSKSRSKNKSRSRSRSRSKSKSKTKSKSKSNEALLDTGGGFSSSLLSGISSPHNYGTTGSIRVYDDDEDRDDASDAGDEHEDAAAEHARIHDATIDALVHTLRNIGTVHSLRGEQDEAMRYFTEVTSLRAQKLAREFENNCQDADDASVETKSFLSGLGSHSCSAFGESASLLSGMANTTTTTTSAENTSTANNSSSIVNMNSNHNHSNSNSTAAETSSSTVMSELNEDVKALDDLFRSISFRQAQPGGVAGGCSSTPQVQTPTSSSNSEKRKSRSGGRTGKKHRRSRSQTQTQTQRQRQASAIEVDDEAATESPFVREASDNGSSSNGTNTSNFSSPSEMHASTNVNMNANTNVNMYTSTHDLSNLLLSSNHASNSGSASSQALEKYQATLEVFVEEGLDHAKLMRPHREKLNSFALRIDLQQTPTQSQQGGSNNLNANGNGNGNGNGNSNTTQAESRADLELALEIYRQVLVAYKEVSRFASSIRMELRLPATSISQSYATQGVPPLLLQSSSSSSQLQPQPQLQSQQANNNDSNSNSNNKALHQQQPHQSQSILSMCSSTESSSSECSSSSSSFFSSELSASSKNQAQRQTSKHSYRQEKRQQIAASIASVLIGMGSVHYRLGNRNDELEAYQRAKIVYSKAFGEEHCFVAGTRKNIGMVLAEKGHYPLAQRQFEKALAIYVRQGKKEWKEQQDKAGAAGNDSQGQFYTNASTNRDVASVISCIGNVKNRVGELDAALVKYVQALQIYKSIYEQSLLSSSNNNSNGNGNGNGNNVDPVEALRDVTATLKVIGMVHAKKGDFDTAMQFFREAMALLEACEQQQQQPPSTAESAAVIDPSSDSSSDGMNTNNPQAALTIRETKASILTRIASIHLKTGALDDAMEAYRQAYDLTVQNKGNTTHHPEIAGILHYIGGIYHKRGEYEEAMSCYQESIRIYHATLGSDHPTVAGTLVMVGSIHYKRRHLDSAMMFYKEALRLNRDAYGMHHPDVAPILKSIGTILTKKGSYQEAYDLFRDVLGVKIAVHGTDHPEVASAYKSLGNVHYKLGELGDAERQYRHALSIYRKCKGDDHPDTVGAKTTIEHLRYWMRERDQQQQQQQQQQRQSQRSSGGDERS